MACSKACAAPTESPTLRRSRPSRPAFAASSGIAWGGRVEGPGAGTAPSSLGSRPPNSATTRNRPASPLVSSPIVRASASPASPKETRRSSTRSADPARRTLPVTRWLTSNSSARRRSSASSRAPTPRPRSRSVRCTRAASRTRNCDVSASWAASISAMPVAVQAREGSPVSSTRGRTATAIAGAGAEAEDPGTDAPFQGRSAKPNRATIEAATSPIAAGRGNRGKTGARFPSRSAISARALG